MKPLMRVSLLLMFAITIFTSCKKSSPKQTKFIPKDAAFVLTINSKTLQSKLASSMASLENVFKTMHQGNDSAVNMGKKEFEDFKNAGLDLDENLYLSVVRKGGSMMKNSGSTIVEGIAGLKDASKFEAYIKKKDASAEVKKEKDYSYVIKNDNMVAWGKDVVVAMAYQRSTSGMMEYDSTTHSYNIKPGAANAQADLLTEMTGYFNMKDDETVSAIPEFRDFANEKADASFWTNSSAAVGDMGIALPKVKELTENTYTAGTINFEDGRINFDSKSYVSRPLADLFKKYTGPTADLNLVTSYPSNNIDGFMVFSLNPDLINGVVNYLEVSAMANNFLTKFLGSNFTLQDVLKAFKGDFAFIVSDIAVGTNPAEPMGMRSRIPGGRVLFNAPIGDKNQMNRLLDVLVQKQMMIKQNNQYQLTPAMQSMGFKVSVDDKNLFITTDSTVLVQYKTKSGKAVLDDNVMKDFKDKSAVAYVDLQKIMGAFPSADTSSSKVSASAKETFRDMKGYADNFNGKFIQGHYEIRFMNEKDNSLTSLLKFFSVAGENYHSMAKTRSEADDEMRVDTAAPLLQKGL